MCTLCRISKISSASKAAAGRCQVAMRFERDMTDEAKAQWMPGLGKERPMPWSIVGDVIVHMTRT